MTIGTTSGDSIMAVTMPLPRKSASDRPIAAIVPSTVATSVAGSPIRNEFCTASRHLSLAKTASYQRVEKPRSG
jgi:hypothetical protein